MALVLALGGVAADADTMEVTFTVAAAPMEVSIDEGAIVELPPVTAGQPAPYRADALRTSTLSYANPSSQPGQARVRVARTTNPDLNGLEIVVSVREHPSELDPNEDLNNRLRTGVPTWRFDSSQEMNLLDRIPTGNANTVTLQWWVASHKDDWDVDLGEVASVFTFTIEQG